MRNVVIAIVVLGLFSVALPLTLHWGQKAHDDLVIELPAEGPGGVPARPGVAFGTASAALIANELDGFTGWRPNDLVIWGPDVLVHCSTTAGSCAYPSRLSI